MRASAALLATAGIGSVLYYLYFLWRRREGLRQSPPLLLGTYPVIGHSLTHGRPSPQVLENYKALHEQYGDFTLVIYGQRMTHLFDPEDFPIIWKDDNFSFKNFSDKFTANITRVPFDEAQRLSLPEKVRSQCYMAVKGKENLAQFVRPLQMKFHEAAESVLHTIAQRPNGDGTCDLARDFLGPIMVFCIMAGQLEGFPAHGEDPISTFENTWTFVSRAALLGIGLPHWLAKKTVEGRDFLVSLNKQYRIDRNVFFAHRFAHRMELTSDDFEKSNLVDVPVHIGLMGNNVPTAFWVLMYLLRKENKVWLERIRAEVDGIFDSKRTKSDVDTDPNQVMLEMEDMPKLGLLMCFIAEVMRMGTNPVSLRAANSDVTKKLSNGKVYHFKKGDYVILHQGPANLAIGDGFDPSRWECTYCVPNPPVNGCGLAGFTIFGGGKSLCPGRYLVIIQLKCLLAQFLYNFDFDIPDAVLDTPTIWDPLITAPAPVSSSGCVVRRRQRQR